MKFILCITIIVTLGFACQQKITNSNKSTYIHPSIVDANKLGIDDKSNQKAFCDYAGGFSGVLLAIHNGKVAQKEGDSIYVSAFYIDATEVCNLHYRAFLRWNDRVYLSIPQASKSLLPDTSIWVKIYPDEAIGNLLKRNYFRNPAFDYYPVVGVTWQQAQAYALWRTDRINEAILIDREKIPAKAKGQHGENHFNTYNFLAGIYETMSGERPMLSIETGQERRVVAADELLVPYYRLPSSEELKQAAKVAKDYSKHKALQAFRKKVEAHTKKYPKPTFYDHKQYRLPYCIIEPKATKAPYHVDENDPSDEWTQQKYTTNKAYIMSLYPGYDADRKPQNYTPIWVSEVINTRTVHAFDKEHSTRGPYKSFRCVMPNLW
jgi:hypothetical protein